jgi:calreticulin
MEKSEQELDVGGAYLKIMSEKVNQSDFDGTSPYYFMFGPDYEKLHTDRIHLIIKKKGKEYLPFEPVHLLKNSRTHMFTYIQYPDLSYEIRIDDEVYREGKLYDHFPGLCNGPMMENQDDKKPEDWIDLPEIPDPKAKKPADWDQPMTIVDEKAVRPEDWDDETMGEWEKPVLPNPHYKGTWMPPLVKNTKYRGRWRPGRIPNPNWENEKRRMAFKHLRYVGFEIYQPNSGTIFDNIFLGDDLDEYRQFVRQTWEPVKRYEDVYEPTDYRSAVAKEVKKRTKRRRDERERSRDRSKKRSGKEEIESDETEDDLQFDLDDITEL